MMNLILPLLILRERVGAMAFVVGDMLVKMRQIPADMSREQWREHRRRRFRRRGRRAYIRSVYFLPSLATLGNAVCGFGAIYVAALRNDPMAPAQDQWTNYFAAHRFLVA